MTTGPMPEYVAVYEPDRRPGLAALLAPPAEPRLATLCRLTVRDGQTYYRPVMRGQLADLAELLDALDQAPAGNARAELLDRYPLPLDAQTPPAEPIPLDDLEMGPALDPTADEACTDGDCECGK